MTHEAWIYGARRVLARYLSAHSVEFDDKDEMHRHACMCSMCLSARNLLETDIQPCIQPAPVDPRSNPKTEWKQANTLDRQRS